ncbi:MAG: type IX secretion system sortase PorU [Muribaculaceae bacterium]|nr:type IX secretion system sortase PorU [Muribaculaceae bacterium]
MKSFRQHITSLVRVSVITAILAMATAGAAAFDLSTYAQSSRLASGNWVKIKVEDSGLHLITTADLQAWGFSDPSKVRVYGYGGQRIADAMKTFADDLPLVHSENTARGIVFYAHGPKMWTYISAGYFYHRSNPFSDYGYYYLSDTDEQMPELDKIGTPGSSESPAETFLERLYHEEDIASPGSTGHILLGEDFRMTPRQSFKFSLPDRADNTVKMECRFATKTYSQGSTLKFTANGEELEYKSTDRINPTAVSAAIFGTATTTRKTFSLESENLDLSIEYSSSGTVYLARLDYIDINYNRLLRLNSGFLNFHSRSKALQLSGVDASTRIWDVTSPTKVYEVSANRSGDKAVWESPNSDWHTYAAWNESATLPSPTFVKKVANQNLHEGEVPDMVIVTHPEWESQATRLAQIHANTPDSLKVKVVTVDQIANEFASGTNDINGIRKYFKMLFDRSSADKNNFKYALLMGRGSYDNRAKTAQVKALGYPIMPSWQSDDGLDDNSSYTTDDILAFLADDSGTRMAIDKLQIAVGRLGVRSLNEARTVVDKIEKYIKTPPSGEWKNKILLIADDQDNAQHMRQTENMWNRLRNSENGNLFFYNKVYTDEYELIGNTYQKAHDRIFRLLNEGSMWWNYVGHANPTSWTHENLITYTEFSNLYLKKLPMLYAATCDFAKCDADALTAGEIMCLNPNGGVIGMISATRPVYIGNNGVLTDYLGQEMLARSSSGRFITAGEMIRRAKNRYAATSAGDTNRLRYILLGDPALPLVIPENEVRLEKINGIEVNDDNQATIKGQQKVTLEGGIYKPDGTLINDFNGEISTTLYDAEHSVTTKGNGDDGVAITFEQQGEMLFTGRNVVTNGRFQVTFSMPAEISDNFRPAALNMYAASNDGKHEAIGCNRKFFVAGFEEITDPDREPPVIDMLVLNQESFKSGDKVNESPMVISSFSDNVGINLSNAGIGHQMTIIVDGTKYYNDVAQYFIPDIDRNGGVIYYPLSNLDKGAHSLEIKVWDTSGNSTTASIEFYVVEGLTPQISEVYATPNPASSTANFYITHNRPESVLNVTISVYDLAGRLVWSTTTTTPSDSFRTAPITWDLSDNAGRRVDRGIYVYRAEISTDGQKYATASRKLAVTSP